MSPAGSHPSNPGLCPDSESNHQHFGLQAATDSLSLSTRALKMCFLFQCNGTETFWATSEFNFMCSYYGYISEVECLNFEVIQSTTSTNSAFIHSYPKCMRSSVPHSNKVFISLIFLNLTFLEIFIVLFVFLVAFLIGFRMSIFGGVYVLMIRF